MGKCKIGVLWMLIVLELYIVTLITSYIWMNILIHISKQKLVDWYFPSPFFLWSMPIYTWGGLAYLLILAVFAGIISSIVYKEISICRSKKR